MAKTFALLVLVVNLSTLKGEDELIIQKHFENPHKKNDGTSYSFSYGVGDPQTGDVKTVWESKDGDTVKGHYSMLESDGSIRTVEYSASPDSGFIATVNNDGAESKSSVKEQKIMENKSYRDYKRPYDLSGNTNLELYSLNQRKNKIRTYDPYKEYTKITGPSYNADSFSSEFAYNPPMKYFRDEIAFNGEPHSYTGLGYDPDCRTKYPTDGSNYLKTLVDLDLRKQKYPFLFSDPYKHDKYKDSSNDDSDRYMHYKLKNHHKSPKPDELGLATSIKYSYPQSADMPVSEHLYQDDIIQRPKKKYRPYKPKDGFYSTEDVNDYIPVSKKKYKKPPRLPDIGDYSSDYDEEYDHRDEYDDRHHKPPRGSGHKEVVRKVIKKHKPSIITLLDILDI